MSPTTARGPRDARPTFPSAVRAIDRVRPRGDRRGRAHCSTTGHPRRIGLRPHRTRTRPPPSRPASGGPTRTRPMPTRPSPVPLRVAGPAPARPDPLPPPDTAPARPEPARPGPACAAGRRPPPPRPPSGATVQARADRDRSSIGDPAPVRLGRRPYRIVATTDRAGRTAHRDDQDRAGLRRAAGDRPAGHRSARHRSIAHPVRARATARCPGRPATNRGRGRDAREQAPPPAEQRACSAGPGRRLSWPRTRR